MISERILNKIYHLTITAFLQYCVNTRKNSLAKTLIVPLIFHSEKDIAVIVYWFWLILISTHSIFER